MRRALAMFVGGWQRSVDKRLECLAADREFDFEAYDIEQAKSRSDQANRQ
jgi:hypothetical protein